MLIADSVADRRPRPRKRGSVVGFLVDPFRRRRVYYESKLEKLLLTTLIANSNVRDLAEQQKVMFWDGEARKHYFDVVVDWHDAGRIAYAIKYERQIKSELRRDLKLIAKQVGDRFATDYRFATEADVYPLTVLNARRVIACGLDFDFEAQEAIRALLQRCGRSVSLAACDAWVKDGRRGSRAAIALVQAGLLAVPDGTSLGGEAILRNCFTN